MKHIFNTGDGMDNSNTTVSERKEITKLLMKYKYPMTGGMDGGESSSIFIWDKSPFLNKFSLDGKNKCIKSFTFDEMKNLIEGNSEPNYEIY